MKETQRLVRERQGGGDQAGSGDRRSPQGAPAVACCEGSTSSGPAGVLLSIPPSNPGRPSLPLLALLSSCMFPAIIWSLMKSIESSNTSSYSLPATRRSLDPNATCIQAGRSSGGDGEEGTHLVRSKPGPSRCICSLSRAGGSPRELLLLLASP